MVVRLFKNARCNKTPFPIFVYWERKKITLVKAARVGFQSMLNSSRVIDTSAISVSDLRHRYFRTFFHYHYDRVSSSTCLEYEKVVGCKKFEDCKKERIMKTHEIVQPFFCSHCTKIFLWNEHFQKLDNIFCAVQIILVKNDQILADFTVKSHKNIFLGLENVTDNDKCTAILNRPWLFFVNLKEIGLGLRYSKFF